VHKFSERKKKANSDFCRSFWSVPKDLRAMQVQRGSTMKEAMSPTDPAMTVTLFQGSGIR
jgi:hypothetical protein